jgi:RNA polymerase sigma-70 factor, ECF subfamily
MDAVLIRRCQAGDDDAFGLLFEQYKNLVYRTAYLTLGTAADAEDVLQEVFLQVHRSLDSYDPLRGSFGAWLYRVTFNRCLNWGRSRRVAYSLESVADKDREAVCSSFESLADRDSVRRALGGLSGKLRVVVVLRHYWGLSYAEIAEILDLPLGTVKSRLNLAMRHMKDDLEPDLSGQAHTVAEVVR